MRLAPEFGDPAGDRLIVPAPAKPYEIAEMFLQEYYADSRGRLLLHHRGLSTPGRKRTGRRARRERSALTCIAGWGARSTGRPARTGRSWSRLTRARGRSRTSLTRSRGCACRRDGRSAVLAERRSSRR
jgi:hypothetical protein